MTGSMIATQRSTVNSWECDRMGHLNVQFYLARWSDAIAHLGLKLGFQPSQARARRIALLASEDRIQFKRELREGAITTIHACVREVLPRGLVVHGEMREGETGISSAAFDSIITCCDLNDDCEIPLPDEVRSRAEAMAGACDLPPPMPPQGGPPPPSGVVAGMYETGRGAVNSWEIDWYGAMAPRFFMARFSDAAAHLLAGAGLDARMMRDRNWGSAALDYRLTYERRLRAGDAIVIKSGLLEVREKVWRFCHLLLDSATGEVVARGEIVALLFDLQTRKSFPFPDDIRARIEPLILGGAG